MTGAEFKAIRQQLGLTQGELAERMGYTHRVAIAQIETQDTVARHIEAHILRVQKERKPYVFGR